MDVPCGPLDRSLLYMQDDHISTKIWEGGKRDKLTLYNLTANMGKWVLEADQRSLLARWGFEGFANPRVVQQNDVSLITALVERWRSETNSFHFPFGELTITLEDVYMILGLPVNGNAITLDEPKNPKVYWMKNWDDPNLGEKQREPMYSGGKNGIKLHSLRKEYGSRPARDPKVPVDPKVIERECLLHTRAYVLFIIGGILFPTSNRVSVHPRYLQLLQEPSEIANYAWGAAVLAHLYRSLGKAAHKSSPKFAGCTLLIQLWAWERVLVGQPRIAPFQELTWPRAVAWAEPVSNRRVNPHHHTGGYRGDFDSFQLYWLNWTPYSGFYEREGADEDDDLWIAHHMALCRIPLIHFDIVELQMSDRVMRQFGMMQHIPEGPFDMTNIRTEKAMTFKRLNHKVIFQSFVNEWHSIQDTGGGLVTEREYASVEEYNQWFMRVSKLRIAPFVVPDDQKILPRDWYNQQFMANAAESGMRLLYEVHKRNPGDWFYEMLPDFLGRYDRAFTEWKGLAWNRPPFLKDEQPPSPPHVHKQPHVNDVREMNIDPSAPASSQQTPAPVLGSHKRTREVDTSGTNSHVEDTTLPVFHKRPREGETGAADSYVHVSPPRPDEPVLQEGDTSAPSTSLEVPVHVSPPCPDEPVLQEGDTSAPSTSLEVPVHVSPPCPDVQEGDTSAPSTSLEVPVHVSPPCPDEPVLQEVETSAPPTSIDGTVHVSPPRHVEPVGQTTSEQTPKAFKLHSSSPGSLGSTPTPIARGFFDVGFSGELPTHLADVLEVDTISDKFFDAQRRVGNKGYLTRPLKERKVRWLFTHWWTGTPGKSDGNFIWYDHQGGQKHVTYQPTHAQLWTLSPDRWLIDDIVNAYAELLAIREENLWKSLQLHRPALKYFFAASFFMVIAGNECPNLLVPPHLHKTPKHLKSMDNFINSYQKQLHGDPIHLCDVAFFPVCTESHWYLFVVDLCKMKVMLIDPIRDEKPTSGREIYPLQFYVMEKFLPYMLNKLHPDRFRANRYMRVGEIQGRPKQVGGVDCGVYVCKYMDAILHELDLGKEKWNPILDVTTFRYRIAHELKQGEARWMPEKSINERLRGCT